MTINTEGTGNNAQGAENQAPAQKLMLEHAAGLLFAEEMSGIAEQGTDNDLATAVEKVKQYNLDELEAHFQHEEQTILRTLVQHYPQHNELCITIGREHGYLRSLVEEITTETARQDLADFGRVLKSHTLLEDQQLFPLVAALFSEDQKDAIESFAPLKRQDPLESPPGSATENASQDDQVWLLAIEQHFNQAGNNAGSIILLPHYNPELAIQMARQTGLAFFDFQTEVMEALREDAENMSLVQLGDTLRDRAEETGIVVHNVEALLSVKPTQERQEWLAWFLDTNWPNPVLLPIAIFQAEVPDMHPRVCDLELDKMPRQLTTPLSASDNRSKYHIEDRE